MKATLTRPAAIIVLAAVVFLQGCSLDAARKATDQGRAEYRLGVRCDEGWGQPLDHAKAIAHWRKAAEIGYAKAQNELGNVYYLGKVLPRDYAEAVRWYRKAAELGDAHAQSTLGSIYEQGQGVPRDYAEAVRWFRKAAEGGDDAGQLSLGTIYLVGQEAPQNPDEAARWLRKAAEQGNEAGQLGIGAIYFMGTGVPQDYLEAYVWLSLAYSRLGADERQQAGSMRDKAAERLAAGQIQEAQRRVREWKPTMSPSAKTSVDSVRKEAEQGDAAAQFELGAAYDGGHGVSQDYAESVRWYRKAAELGNTAAQLQIGIDYDDGHGVSKDYAEAARWYLKAAEQGSARAQAKLGFLYHDGNGVPKNGTEALRWLRKAADQGDAGGQMYIGTEYFKGEGVPRDLLEGYIWLTLALSHDGSEQSTEVRDSFARLNKMSAEQIAEADRQAQEWKPTGEAALFPSLSAQAFQGIRGKGPTKTREKAVPENSGRAVYSDGKGNKTCMTTVCDPNCRMVSVPCN